MCGMEIAEQGYIRSMVGRVERANGKSVFFSSLARSSSLCVPFLLARDFRLDSRRDFYYPFTVPAHRSRKGIEVELFVINGLCFDFQSTLVLTSVDGICHGESVLLLPIFIFNP